MAEFLEHSIGHLKLDERRMPGTNETPSVISPAIKQEASIDELTARMLASDLYLFCLNTKSKTDRFDLEFTTVVEMLPCSEHSHDYKERVQYSSIKRTPLLWTKYTNRVQIYPIAVSDKCGEGDLLDYNQINPLNMEQKLFRAANNVGFRGSIDSLNTSSLCTIVRSGDEGRMLALKAVLVMKQLALAYSVTGVDFYADQKVFEVPTVDWNDICDAANEYSFIVNVTDLPQLSVSILCNLIKQWPFQQLRRRTADGESDIYSNVFVADDKAYIYSTRPIKDKVHGGICMPPHKYWSYLQIMFSKLGMLDQLYEVLRDTRGLVPALVRYAHSVPAKSKEEYYLSFQLRYGPTSSAYTVSDWSARKNFQHFSLTGQLAQSTTMLVHDLVLGYMFWNNVHHLVEELGIGNPKLYNEKRADIDKVSSILIDHGYAFDGPKCGLYRKLMPWVPALCGGGASLRAMVMTYSTALRRRYVSQEDDSLSSWSFIPLGFYDNIDSRLTSQWALHNPHDFSSKIQTTKANEVHTIHDSCVWTAAVGLDGYAVPVGGALLIGESRYREIGPKDRGFTRYTLNGHTYQLKRVFVYMEDTPREHSAGSVLAVLTSPSHEWL